MTMIATVHIEQPIIKFVMDKTCCHQQTDSQNSGAQSSCCFNIKDLRKYISQKQRQTLLVTLPISSAVMIIRQIRKLCDFSRNRTDDIDLIEGSIPRQINQILGTFPPDPPSFCWKNSRMCLHMSLVRIQNFSIIWVYL